MEATMSETRDSMPSRGVVISRIAATLLSGWGTRVLPDDIRRAIDDAEIMLNLIEERYGGVPVQQRPATPAE
jgi:hypothetical protein